MRFDMAIISLDEYRPHVCINTREAVHVVPVSVIEGWVKGTIEPEPECVRQIIREWLDHLIEE